MEFIKFSAERYSIMLINYSQTEAIVEPALNQFRRKALARDDILDALALAVSAKLGLKSIRTSGPSPTIHRGTRGGSRWRLPECVRLQNET